MDSFHVVAAAQWPCPLDAWPAIGILIEGPLRGAPDPAAGVRAPTATTGSRRISRGGRF
ncbi:hypothetical protein OH799_32435 [Nocardia sp. NBC_00881]|uniref:hypothetical protein n=1 Tax=Nocardia sp. NBC_00881 TaxID=2975995 RepID=UPI0038694D66|nr:hypothetical protein OH799_32435 [Nocardia sp. NBC_00881]